MTGLGEVREVRADELRTLRAQRDEVEDLVLGAWTAGGLRGPVVWCLLSAYLAGLRARISLIERGWRRWPV